MKNKDKYFLGAFLVALGIILALGQFDFWHIIYSIIFDFWPLIIVAGGIHRIAHKSTVSGIFIACVGVFLLCHTLFNISLHGFFWPIILMGAGVSVLCSAEEKSSKKDEEDNDQDKVDDNYIDDTRIFWNTSKKLVSKDFTGGTIDNIFGRYLLDLTKCVVSDSGAKLEINTVLGAVDVIVPKNCRVIVNGESIFGTWETELDERDIEKPVLKITGTAIFGGVKVTE
ncbi:MAG TPA: LiaF-related protein [Candidatus Dojkabacteria bacterium]|nr:LiaF-related protein [Candidatus Dojkabacteria bacterium]